MAVVAVVPASPPGPAADAVLAPPDGACTKPRAIKASSDLPRAPPEHPTTAGAPKPTPASVASPAADRVPGAKPDPSSAASSREASPPTADSVTLRAAHCVCEGCSHPHDGSYGSGRFCSVHCARRVAASRKWEKQRSARKRLAATAATAAAEAAGATCATVEPSTSSLSSTSSLDPHVVYHRAFPHSEGKRRRVVMMPHPAHVAHSTAAPNPLHGAFHAPQPLHARSHFSAPTHLSELVQPRPQLYAPHHGLPLQMQPPAMGPHPGVSCTPMAATPPPYAEYSQMSMRAVSPFQYATPSPQPFYPYAAHQFTRTPPPPLQQPHATYTNPFPVFSPHTLLPPPPPPPTPAPDASSISGHGASNKWNKLAAGNAGSVGEGFHPVPQAQVASERDCNTVAEALLCLQRQ